MTTSVYANGVRATAVAAIKAAAIAKFTAIGSGLGADGIKRLDVAGLTKWLQDQFVLISADSGLPAGANTADIDLAARAFNTGPAGSLVGALNNRIRPETLSTRPDYPDMSPGSLYPRIVASVVDAKATLKRLSDDIAAYYNEAYRYDDESLLVRALIADFKAKGKDTLIKPAVQRLVETRAYIATHVTAIGEESAPSPVSALIELDQNDTVTIGLANLSAGWASRNITHVRLYRSLSGNASAEFQYVPHATDPKGWPVTTGSNFSGTDSNTPEKLGEVCPSSDWDEPPYRTALSDTAIPPTPYGTNPYLRGLVGMPNGVMAGFFDATVCFCEPYHPYAWPFRYQISLRHDVVGLGVFGQTLFVGTVANPYFITGSDSASMSAIKLDSNQACASARSIVEVPGGVLYASPDGLCLASNDGIKVLTSGIFTREDWQALTPSSIFAAEHDGVYYFWYTGGSGGCYALDLTSGKLVRTALTATAALTDKYSDTLYLATRTAGTTYVTPVLTTGHLTGKWRSKIFVLPMQASFAWLSVLSNFSAAVTVRLYADNTVTPFYTVSITSSTPVRLPAGRWKEWEIEIETTARVTEVVIASSTQELQAV